MKFVIPRDPDAQPIVIDRLGRNLSAHGIDLIGISYSIAANGAIIELHLGGTATPLNGLPTPFRIVTGTHVADTRLYDHTNVELVNALRAATITPASSHGLVAYIVTIPLRPDDTVEISPAPTTSVFTTYAS